MINFNFKMFKEATNEKIIISVLSATLLLAGCSSHDGQQSKKQSNNSVDTSKVKIKTTIKQHRN